MRLLVDEKCVIDDLKPHALKIDSGAITLQAGKLTSILLRTTQPAGAGSIKLQWSSPSRPLEVIPAARLYPPLFSPAMLVYAESADPHSSVLYTTTFDGPAKKLTVAGCSQPVFTPDGKQIIFRTVANAAIRQLRHFAYHAGRHANRTSSPGPAASAVIRVSAATGNTSPTWRRRRPPGRSG